MKNLKTINSFRMIFITGLLLASLSTFAQVDSVKVQEDSVNVEESDKAQDSETNRCVLHLKAPGL